MIGVFPKYAHIVSDSDVHVHINSHIYIMFYVYVNDIACDVKDNSQNTRRSDIVKFVHFSPISIEFFSVTGESKWEKSLVSTTGLGR